LDDIDLKILRILQTDSAISIVDLALKVGLSHTPCWRRVKALEESGAIRGRAVLLDPVVMGLGVNVLANIKLKAHDEATLEAFEQAARDRPEIVDVSPWAGKATMPCASWSAASTNMNIC